MQMQGALGLVAEYDMYGAKLGSSEIVVAPICLAYSKDGSLLIAVLKVPPRTFCRNFIGSPTTQQAQVLGLLKTVQRPCCHIAGRQCLMLAHIILAPPDSPIQPAWQG